MFTSLLVKLVLLVGLVVLDILDALRKYRQMLCQTKNAPKN